MKSSNLRICTALCLSFGLVSNGAFAQAPAPPEDFQPPVPVQGGQYELLFMGNSHTAANGLPNLVAALIELGIPGATATQATAPGYLFLADRINDGVSRPLLESRNWSHVILQAQKYSTSGLYDYPTVAAEEWIRSAKSQGAQAILFPEWPRRGNTEEGPRIQQLHLDIASREPACVAPVGLAWEAALERYPGLVLHAADGNHSALPGALLTAFVLYQVITGEPAADLPVLTTVAVNSATQQNLKVIASEVVENNGQTCVSGANLNPDGIPTLSAPGIAIMILAVAAAFAGRFRPQMFISR